jgi:predicted permease
VNWHTGNTEGSPAGHLRATSFSTRIYRELAGQQQAFSSVVGFSDVNQAGLVAERGSAEQTALQYVSTNFFAEMGVRLPLGRAFLPEEDRVGQEPVAVISHRLWQNAFGGDREVLGRRLRLNNVPTRIVGVAPPGFYGLQIGDWTDVYVPLAARMTLDPGMRDAGGAERDNYWWVRMMARLPQGASEAETLRSLTAQYQRLLVPDGVTLEPEKVPSLVASPGARGFDRIGGNEARALWILLLLVGLVLLMVCANVANLLLARGVARQREAAVRLSLGAPRWRLLRQQLVECLLLAALGGALGLALGHTLAGAIHNLILSSLRMGGFDLQLDPRMLLFTAGVSIFTAFLFGVAPGMRLARVNLSGALKVQDRGVVSGNLRLPKLLVVLQIALCLSLLVPAGLLGRSLANLKGQDIGFPKRNLLYASLNPWRAGYTEEQVPAYLQRMREAIAAIPGVASAGLISNRPLSGSVSERNVAIPGKPFKNDGTSVALLHTVSDGVLETMGVPLLAGRTFQPADMRPDSNVTVVDETFANRYFPGQNPVGLRFGTEEDESSRYEIVGLVKSTRYHNLRRERQPIMYHPLSTTHSVGRGVHFIIRSHLDAGDIGAQVRQAAATVDPAVPLYEFQTQGGLIDNFLRMERLLSVLSSAFSIVALVLAAVGWGGLLAYSVARRRSEIGLRMALGASPRRVMNMVVGDALRLMAAGVIVGLPCAYALGELLRSLLYGLEPADPATAVGSLLVLGAAALLAAWLPARRASRVDPMLVLREE